MNIFRRELRAHRLGLLLWALGMVFLIGAGMAKFAAYETAGQSVQEIMDALPRAVLVVFGITGFDLSTASGFFGVLFLYIAVMAAVHAVLLGANLISKEERDKTSEFLFAKPITRAAAVTGKLLAGLVQVVVLNLITTASSLYFVGRFGGQTSDSGKVAALMVGLFLLQLVFLAVGAAMAGVVRSPKAAPTAATAVMLTTFLIYYLVNLEEDLGFLRFLSPFKYFDAATVMADGLDPVYVALALLIVVLAGVGLYRAYPARDLDI